MFEQFDPLELVSKKPHTVVLMLDSPEEHVLQGACEALYKFAEKCKLVMLCAACVTGCLSPTEAHYSDIEIEPVSAQETTT